MFSVCQLLCSILCYRTPLNLFLFCICYSCVRFFCVFSPPHSVSTCTIFCLVLYLVLCSPLCCRFLFFSPWYLFRCLLILVFFLLSTHNRESCSFSLLSPHFFNPAHFFDLVLVCSLSHSCFAFFFLFFVFSLPCLLLYYWSSSVLILNLFLFVFHYLLNLFSLLSVVCQTLYLLYCLLSYSLTCSSVWFLLYSCSLSCRTFSFVRYISFLRSLSWYLFYCLLFLLFVLLPTHNLHSASCFILCSLQFFPIFCCLLFSSLSCSLLIVFTLRPVPPLLVHYLSLYVFYSHFLLCSTFYCVPGLLLFFPHFSCSLLQFVLIRVPLSLCVCSAPVLLSLTFSSVSSSTSFAQITLIFLPLWTSLLRHYNPSLSAPLCKHESVSLLLTLQLFSNENFRAAAAQCSEVHIVLELGAQIFCASQHRGGYIFQQRTTDHL